MRIKIEIWSNTSEYSVLADNKANTFTIGNNIITSDISQFIFDAYDIVKTWPEKVVDLDINDGIKYTIEFFDDFTTRQWIGCNSTPKTFIDLVSLINNYDPDTKDNYYFEEE